MAVNVYWIGDSTVHFNRMDTWPQCGMGQVLDLYLKPEVTVHDCGENGRSTKSFWDLGHFAPVLAALLPGDVVLIQFGHNDGKVDDPARYTTQEEYRANLLRYVTLCREKGALPVLITPLTRRWFQEGRLLESHGAYPGTMRELAAREGVPLVDLTASSRAEVERLGDEASKAYYMQFAPGVYPNYPQGMADNTHLRYAGAVAFTGLVADGLRALGSPYSDLLL